MMPIGCLLHPITLTAGNSHRQSNRGVSLLCSCSCSECIDSTPKHAMDGSVHFGDVLRNQCDCPGPNNSLVSRSNSYRSFTSHHFIDDKYSLRGSGRGDPASILSISLCSGFALEFLATQLQVPESECTSIMISG